MGFILGYNPESHEGAKDAPLDALMQGDMTGDGTHTYQWDAEGRLISVDSGSTASYVYNALGERVRKDSGGTILDSQYGIQGNLIAYGDTQPSFVTWQDYLYAGGRMVGLYADSATRFAHPNALGSTSVLTDQTGSETQDELYYPWGDRWQAQGSVVDERFAGMRQRDTESDLYPTQFRNYSPGLGRWMSPDPSGLAAVSLANPQTWNMYAYVGNNPTTFMDPLGLLRSTACEDNPRLAGCPNPPTVAPAGDGSAPTLDSVYQPDTGYTAQETGGGGGGAPAAQPAANKSQNCSKGLREAHANQDAVNRALQDWNILQTTRGAHGIDPAMLAAIGIRESGFRNIWQNRGGQGAGIFQIDLGKNPSVMVAQAFNPTWAANHVANMLSSNMAYLAGRFPKFTPSQLLQATAASYNIGRGGISGNPNTIDMGTAGNNYGSDVLLLMDCF